MQKLKLCISIMSKLVPMLCYECGAPLADVYPAFCAARELCNAQIKNIHVQRRAIHDSPVEMNEVLNALQINRNCCRAHLLCTVLPSDLSK